MTRTNFPKKPPTHLPSHKHRHGMDKCEDVISAAVREALKVFADTWTDPVDQVLAKAIRPIANAAGIDAVSIVRFSHTEGNTTFGQVYRWVGTHGEAIAAGEHLLSFQIDSGFGEWISGLRADECINATISQIAESQAELLKPFSVKSLLVAPLFSNGTLWGAAAFFSMSEEKHFDCESHLRSAAQILANFLIENDRARAAQEASASDKRESDRSLSIMKNILNALDTMIYVTNPKTDEILFINDNMKRHFSLDQAAVGDVCYKVLQKGKEKRCDFCPCHELDKDPSNTIEWVEQNPLTKRTYKNTDCYIDWPNGSKVHLQHSIDFTEALEKQSVLEKILNSMDFYIFVSDMETDEILFANKKMSEDYAQGREIRGEKCWKMFQKDQTGRCSFCKKGELAQNPFETMIWDRHSEYKDMILRVIDGTITWTDGRRVHLQRCMDITEAVHSNKATECRRKMAEALNMAATHFLHAGAPSLISEGMKAIADCMDIHRIYIWKSEAKDGDGFFANKYEWNDGIPAHKNPKLAKEGLHFANGYIWASDSFSNGMCINGPVSKMSGPDKESLLSHGIKSILQVPVNYEGQFWGLVSFDDCETERYFTDDEVHLLRTAGYMMVNTFIRNGYLEKLNQANKLNELMFDVSPLCNILWDKEYRVVSCNEAAVKLLEVKDKQEFIDKFLSFAPVRQPNGEPSIEKLNGCLKKAFTSGECTFGWTHQMANGSPMPTEITLKRVEHDGSRMVVAFMQDMRVINKIKNMEADIKWLEREAHKAYHDALTGIYNRYYLDSTINVTIRTLSKNAGTLTFMMADIDFFKLYNDTYGHIEGDKCLVAIADVIAKSMERTDDFVARFGGEEFAIALPNTDEEGARRVVTKIMNGLRQRAMPHSNSATSYVTISIGSVTGKVEPNNTFDDFLKIADEMLYRSKQSGRNQASFATLNEHQGGAAN